MSRLVDEERVNQGNKFGFCFVLPVLWRCWLPNRKDELKNSAALTQRVGRNETHTATAGSAEVGRQNVRGCEVVVGNVC